jgi:hypothetical protein
MSGCIFRKQKIHNNHGSRNAGRMDTDKIWIDWQGGQSFRLRGAPKRREGATAAARRSSECKLRRARLVPP